jgi:hypothetical protein
LFDAGCEVPGMLQHVRNSKFGDFGLGDIGLGDIEMPASGA